jgi:hypothetical protein
LRICDIKSCEDENDSPEDVERKQLREKRVKRERIFSWKISGESISRCSDQAWPLL